MALAAVTAALRGLGAPAGAASTPGDAIVSIESLAPSAPPSPPLTTPTTPTTPADRARASAATRAPSRPPPAAEPIGLTEAADIAGSWAVYQRMVAAGVGPASLEELLKAPSADTARPAPAPITRATAAVDIRTLLYKGDRAQQRAQVLREMAKRASGDELRAIIDEVCDLVVLAIEPE